MRILIGCEFSGIVRDAFLARGHDAVSCDLLPPERPGPHIQGDVLDVMNDDWDMLLAFPPCTYLARSGARWWPTRRPEQQSAIAFVLALANAPIPRIAIENPVGILSTVWRKPDQVIQPWMFGHGEVKKTCLWLQGLPPLLATGNEAGRTPRVHYAAPGPERWRERSRTLPGFAKAMAAQWSQKEAR